MRPKRVIPREAAHQDVDDAVTYYLSEGSEQAAWGFVDALEQAYTHIGRHPATGSTRYAHELNLAGLRSWVHAQFVPDPLCDLSEHGGGYFAEPCRVGGFDGGDLGATDHGGGGQARCR